MGTKLKINTSFTKTKISILFFVVMTFFIQSCSKTITSGEFYDLKIGMSKDEVIYVLKNKPHINSIVPELSENVLVSGKSKNREENINKILLGEGFIVNQGSPTRLVRVGLNNGEVDYLDLAPVNKGDDLGFKMGMKRDDVRRAIQIYLRKDNSGEIYNTVSLSSGLSRLKFSELEGKKREWLFSYDCWGFSGVSDYSFTKVCFEKEKLNFIHHKWSPIELP